MTTTETPEQMPSARAAADWRADPSQNVVFVKSGGNGLAITGFVGAMLALVSSFVPLIGWIGAFFWGIFGLTFSLIGWRKATRVAISGHKGLAIAGAIISVLAFVIGIANIAVTSAAVNEVDKSITKAGQQWSSYSDCMDHVQVGSSTFSQDMDVCSALLKK